MTIDLRVPLQESIFQGSGDFDFERGVLSQKTEAGDATAYDDLGLGGTEIRPHRVHRSLLELRHQLRQVGVYGFEGCEDLSLGKAFDDRAGQADRAEQSGMRGDQDGRDPQVLRDCQCMLRSGPPKSNEGVLARIVATAQRDAADRARHALVGDRAEALEQILHGDCLRGVLFDAFTNLAERTFGGWWEEGNGETRGIDAAEQKIDVRHREGSAESVAGRTWIRAGTGGSDAQTRIDEATNRTASGGHAFDRQGGCQEVRVADGVLKAVGEIAIVARDIRARTPHVEGQETRMPGRLARQGGSRDAAGRSAEEAVLCQVGRRVRQTARTRHDVELTAPEGGANALEIGLDRRRQRGIDDRRLRAREDFDEGRERRGTGDVRESRSAQHLRDALFMGGILVGMQERDRSHAVTGGHQLGGGALEFGERQSLDLRSVGR